MIFNWLQFSLENKIILDLFAGTGNLGFEALSRSAKQATFIDKSRAAAKIIAKNAILLNLQDQVEIIHSDVFRAIRSLAERQRYFDLIFADPPYEGFLSNKILAEIASHNILKNGSIIILEHQKHDMPEEEINTLTLARQKTVGDTCISFYEKR